MVTTMKVGSQMLKGREIGVFSEICEIILIIHLFAVVNTAQAGVGAEQ